MRKFLMPVLAAGLLACAPEAPPQDENTIAIEAAAELAGAMGPAVGATFPEFSLEDVGGEVRSLADIAGPNGTVIYFNRSVDWCPYCQQQTLEINAMRRLFEARGFGVAVITYDTLEELQAFAEMRDIAIPLLSDPDNALTDELGIRDPVYTDPEHYAYGVPYPMTFIVSPDGVITHKLWHEPGFGEERGYRSRVTVGAVLQLIGAL